MEGDRREIAGFRKIRGLNELRSMEFLPEIEMPIFLWRVEQLFATQEPVQAA